MSLIDIGGMFGGILSLLILVFKNVYKVFHIGHTNRVISEAIIPKKKTKSVNAEPFSNKKKKNPKKSETFKQIKKEREIVDEVIKKASDGLMAQRRIIDVGILTDLFFKDFQKALIPLIMFEDAKTEIKASQLEAYMKKISSNIDANSTISIDLSENLLDRKEGDSGKEMSQEAALQRLKTFNPSSDFEKIVNEYFLARIPKEYLEVAEADNVPSEEDGVAYQGLEQKEDKKNESEQGGPDS